MVQLVSQALRAGSQDAPAAAPAARRPAVLVVGAGGALGSAVVEALLAGGAFAPVRVLVAQDLRAGLDGLESVAAPVSFDADPGADAQASAPLADTALIVFDRIRHANGRDDAFWRAEPALLPAIAAWLQRGGVRRLLVVLPHQVATLPQALKAGLASLDEQAVAALGFEHFIIVRSAQPPAASPNRGLQKLADLVLAQLRLMTPQPEQPVRAKKVAELAARLAARLPSAAPGTRVMAPEWVWHAAQVVHIDTVVDAWLAGRPPPPRPTGKIRL